MHVVLLAHGSRDPRHAATIERIAAALDERSLRATVGSAFLDLTAPTLAEAVTPLPDASEVIVVPMLLTRAFHAGVDVPAAMESATAARPDLTLRTAAVLGPSPLLTTAMDRRIREAGVDAAERGTAVLMIAAGSSDDDARAQVAHIASQWLTGPRRGTHAFAAGPGPDVATAVSTLAELGDVTRIVAAPYLLAPGALPDHAFAEARARGAAHGIEVVIADVIGDAPEVLELVPARARAAAS